MATSKTGKKKSVGKKTTAKVEPPEHQKELAKKFKAAVEDAGLKFKSIRIKPSPVTQLKTALRNAGMHDIEIEEVKGTGMHIACVWTDIYDENGNFIGMKCI